MSSLSERAKIIRALLQAAHIRRKRLVERISFETGEIRALRRALRATTNAAHFVPPANILECAALEDETHMPKAG